MELYLERIKIDDTYSIQIEPVEQEKLIIYENDVEIDHFSLKKRIFTLFKILQEYTNAEDYVVSKEKNYKLYGKPIHINDHVYMKVSDKYPALAIDFYKKGDGKEDELIYLTKMNYYTQKLFSMMLIPEKLNKEPNYKVLNPAVFKDLMDILSMIKI